MNHTSEINDGKKKIARFIFKLQKQTTVPHWSLANQNINYFLPLNKKPILGPRQNKLKTIIKYANKFHVTDLVIFFVGFLSAFRLWKFARKKQKDNMNYKKVFFGFGARAEEHMFKTYISNTNFSVLRINTSNLSNIGLAGCPSFCDIVLNIIKNSFGHTKKIRSAIHEISSNMLYFSLSAAMNIGDYCFYCAYWEMVQHNGADEIIFVVPDVASFASTTLKIKTIFLQHGLLGLPILMPQFDQMEVLTQDEQSYYQYLLPNKKILKRQSISKSSNIKNNVILILSANTNNRAIQLYYFVEWAITNGFQIIIRPTPTVTLNELKLLNESLSNFYLDDVKLSFEESMEKWNPIAVVDWTSTVLAISLLHYHCLPISFYDHVVGEPLWEKRCPNIFEFTIYPFLNRCLFWSKEQDLIKQALKSKIEYDKQIKRLQVFSDEFIKNLACQY